MPKTLASDLREELEEMITLGDGDAERTVSRQRAILGNLTARAIEGDPKAIAMVLDLAQRLTGAKPEYETEYGDIDFEVARERVARRIAELARQMADQGSSESRESSKLETNGDDPEPRS